MAASSDPRLRPLVLDARGLAEREAGLRESGLGPEALAQVQQWTPDWIRFGRVPSAHPAKRLGAAVGAAVLLLLAAWFAWLEHDPEIKTSPAGGGYVAAAVFAAAALGLFCARRWMRPGRFAAPRVLIDLKRRTSTTPRGPERACAQTRWVLFKWHSHAGMADTRTSLVFALEPSWELSGFDRQHSEEAHHALSNHRQSLLEDVTLTTAMEIGEKLIELGVAERIDIDPPVDGRDSRSELEARLRPGFRLWMPGSR